MTFDITWSCENSSQVSPWPLNDLSVTSPAIVHPCSRFARTVTWRELSQFSMICSTDNTCSPWIFFCFHYFFSYLYLERSTIHFFCPIVISTGMIENKNSKFESEGRIFGNSLGHHGIFPPFNYIFFMNIEDIFLFFFTSHCYFSYKWKKKKIEIRNWDLVLGLWNISEMVS